MHHSLSRGRSEGAAQAAPLRRVLLILLVVIIAVTLSDMAVSLRHGASPGWEASPAAAPTSTRNVFPAQVYLAMDGKARSANHAWTNTLDHLQQVIELGEDHLPTDPELRQAVLERSAARRTYPGAREKKPTPLLPHPIDGQSTETCLLCHGAEGKAIGYLVAPPLKHKPMDNCGRCHVPAESLAAP